MANSDSCIPSDLATETPEERAPSVIRRDDARDDLVLMQPLRFYVRGQVPFSDRHVSAPRSRFLMDDDLAAFE